MPRPSDVYATLGAPGVYQATPCTPSPLPNVYVVPPEEDNQDVYCLFHSGSASPTTFESFYNHPVYTQRDPNSPTLTDLRTLDHALSYFQRHSATYTSARYGSEHIWNHDEVIQTTSRSYPRSTASSASSRSSLSESLRGSSQFEVETTADSSARQSEAEGQCEEKWQYQSNLSSRRSSVFGDRPPDYEALESRVREEDQQASRKSQRMTFRSRAAMALKGLGGAMSRRPETQAPIIPDHRGSEDRPAVHESWFEPKPLRKKQSYWTLAHSRDAPIGVPSLAHDVNLEVAPTHPLSSVRDSKLTKRKSVAQLFGLGRPSIMESGTVTNSAYPHSDLEHPAARSSSSLVTSVRQLKISKRKSMAQLLGKGRDTSTAELSDQTIVAVDVDETGSGISEVPHVAAPRSQEGPYSYSAIAKLSTTGPDSRGSQSLVSLVIPGSTAPPERRKSFMSRRSFSFLDLHRHFSTDHGPRPSLQAETTPPAAPVIDPSASFSPDSLSEGTDTSSSVATLTECEQTIEDDMHFPESHISTIMGQGGVALAKDFEPNLLTRSQLDLNADIEDIPFSPRCRLEALDDEVESETGEDPPMLELAVGLNSLTFDQLIFDPESFEGSVYD